jgi:hypothetical protein
MRSTIAKLAILLALPLSLLAGCSGSIEGEVRSAIRSEKENVQKFKTLGLAYVRSCVKTIRVIAADQLGENPLAILSVTQYCSSLADANSEKLSSVRQAAALGCVQAQLSNNGLPSNSEQENAIVAFCVDLTSSVLGLNKDEKKAEEAATGPTGEASHDQSGN